MSSRHSFTGCACRILRLAQPDCDGLPKRKGFDHARAFGHQRRSTMHPPNGVRVGFPMLDNACRSQMNGRSMLGTQLIEERKQAKHVGHFSIRFCLEVQQRRRFGRQLDATIKARIPWGINSFGSEIWRLNTTSSLHMIMLPSY